MIYIDSVAIQAQQMIEIHGLTIYSANVLAQWVIQSWSGVGSLALELFYGSLYGTLLERYMCKLSLAYYMEGNVEKAWDEFVAVMECTEEVETTETCPICFEEVGSGVQLKCRHMFHERCIHTWFERKTTCPMCRFDIINDVSQMSE